MALEKEINIWVNGLEKALTISKSSRYAIIFDGSSSMWMSTIKLNTTFISANMQYANNCLQHRGHLFLNEVHDTFGKPRTAIGAIVGWVRDGDGDNYVDFIVEVLDDNSILIDFNIDGIIVDKLI